MLKPSERITYVYPDLGKLFSSDIHFWPAGVTSPPYSPGREASRKTESLLPAEIRDLCRPVILLLVLVPTRVCFCHLHGARNVLVLHAAEARGNGEGSAVAFSREEALGLPGASVLYHNQVVFILAFSINIKWAIRIFLPALSADYCWGQVVTPAN